MISVMDVLLPVVVVVVMVFRVWRWRRVGDRGGWVLIVRLLDGKGFGRFGEL